MIVSIRDYVYKVLAVVKNLEYLNKEIKMKTKKTIKNKKADLVEKTTYGHLDENGILVKGLELTIEECNILKFIHTRENTLNKHYAKLYIDPLNVCCEGVKKMNDLGNIIKMNQEKTQTETWLKNKRKNKKKWLKENPGNFN
jgi:hypothetical protein